MTEGFSTFNVVPVVHLSPDPVHQENILDKSIRTQTIRLKQTCLQNTRTTHSQTGEGGGEGEVGVNVAGT